MNDPMTNPTNERDDLIIGGCCCSTQYMKSDTWFCSIHGSTGKARIEENIKSMAKALAECLQKKEFPDDRV